MMRSLMLTLVATLVLWPAQSRAQSDSSLTHAINQMLDTRPLAWWGVMITETDTDEVLYARNADRSFMPASVTKIFTTAAALDQLGPDFRFETRLYHDGVITNGVLNGNLIIRGSGDPSAGSPGDDHLALFDAWTDSLAAMGVVEIRGDIIGDDDIFDDTQFGAGWSWDDLVYSYAAPVSGLTFHENMVDLTIQPTSVGQPGVITWAPAVDKIVEWVNRSETVTAGGRLREKYTRSLYSTPLTLETQIPVDRIERESISVTNPTLFFAEVFRQHLAVCDIVTHGTARDIDDLPERYTYDSLHVVARHTSAPLSELAAITNKDSQNLYAEHLLRTLGVHRPIADTALRPGSQAMGHQAALRTFAAAGADTVRMHLADGSGLSRRNLITPRMTVAVLQYMAAHEDIQVRQAFDASLAVGGIDGTLEFRFPEGAPARGTVRAKTGTIGNVSALAGYVESASGREYTFAIFCNHFIAPYSVIRDIQDRVINHLAQSH